MSLVTAVAAFVLGACVAIAGGATDDQPDAAPTTTRDYRAELGEARLEALNLRLALGRECARRGRVVSGAAGYWRGVGCSTVIYWRAHR